MPYKDPEARREYHRQRYLRIRDEKLAYAKKYREDNPESVAAAKRKCYDRIKDDPEYKKARSEYGKQRRQANPEHVKAIEKQSRIKHKDRIAAYHKSISKTIQRRAREAVRRAIKSGKLDRACDMECHECGEQANEYHHPSYERGDWLTVIPVCYQCHKDIHLSL